MIEKANNQSMENEERRKCPRVSICVPLSYTCEDSKGNCLEQSICVAKDVSQTGIKIETFQEVHSKFIALMFVDFEKRSIEARGEVVYCRKIESGKFVAGIKFQDSAADNIRFVSEIVRFYHYQKDTPRAFISSAGSD